jgi:hypothetical protein
MNRVLLKELIFDDFNKWHESYEYEGTIIYDNLSLIDVYDNYKNFSEKHFLNTDDRVFFLSELINLYQFSFFEINDKLQKIINMLNEELNQLNQKETIFNDSNIDVLKNNEKENRIQIKCAIINFAYLFYKLREDKIIECQNLAKALSNIIIDENGNPIDNKLFNKYFYEFRDGKFPKKTIDIDDFIKKFKKV